MFSCSQCDFKANFESALIMHRQLHHGTPAGPLHQPEKLPVVVRKEEKYNMPIMDKMLKSCQEPSSTSLYSRKVKGLKLTSRTSSATRLLGRLRARICRSKVLTTNREDLMMFTPEFHDLSSRSECTSKAMKLDFPSRTMSPVREIRRETFACHLCDFDADRITVLDRHLLNDHKIGLDNLLKLVLAKTRDGLSEECPPDIFAMRQPYYRATNSDDVAEKSDPPPLETVEVFSDCLLDDGEFLMEKSTTRIRRMKHAGTNTDLTWTDIPDLKDNCQMITHELDKLIRSPSRLDRDELLHKMQTLSDYMCKFVDSSNTLKKALNRDAEGRNSSRREMRPDDSLFELKLGDSNTPRAPRSERGRRSLSEKSERFRTKHSGKFRTEKPTLSSESYYF